MPRFNLAPRWLIFTGTIFLGIIVVSSLALTAIRYQQQQKIQSRVKSVSQKAVLIPTATPTVPSKPTATPTIVSRYLEWQLYTHRGFGFQIRYPEDWEFAEARSQPPDVHLRVYPSRWRGQQLPWATSANIKVDSSQHAKTEFEKLQNRQEDVIWDSKVETIDLAGVKCLRVTSQLPNTGGFGPETWCWQNNLVYKFQVFAYYPPKSEKDLAEEILQTFRFLK